MKRFKSFLEILSNASPLCPSFEYFVGEERRVLTYSETIEKIFKFPLPKASVVGVFATSSIEVVIAILALAGKRRLVLLNPDDNPMTLEAQIKATHVGALLGDKEYEEEFASLLEPEYTCEDTDILFFTSGTTSKAKAVVLTEASLCSAAYNGGALLPLKKEDSLLSVLPLSHVYGFVCALLWPLSFGAKVCLGRGLRSIFFDFEAFRPSVTTLVPQMAAFLASKKLFNPELKLILIGAGQCEKGIIDLIKSFGIRVSFGYGLTETSSGIALSLDENPYEMTICPDYRVSIREDGEIVVESDTTLMKGYYDDEASTKAVLAGNKLLTGDFGRIENGYLFVTGRKKEILVFNDGSKLFLPEYEGELLKRLGREADFCVLQNKNGNIVLYIYQPSENIEELVKDFNKDYPRSHRIVKIVKASNKLPRTKTQKVQRYLIPL